METKVFDSKSKRSMITPLLYEFFGTAIVTYSFNLSAGNYFVRACAYLIGWLLAANVSGAHFSPATTLAVFIYEKKASHFIYMLACMLTQFAGAFLGVVISFALVKFSDATLYPSSFTGTSSGDILYFDLSKDFADTTILTPKYARLLL